jgi:hypothetical protein
MYSPVLESVAPVEKPVATRAGTPPIRSSSAIAPENCWQ